jgi:hypothetical protein
MEQVFLALGERIVGLDHIADIAPRSQQSDCTGVLTISQGLARLNDLLRLL